MLVLAAAPRHPARPGRALSHPAPRAAEAGATGEGGLTRRKRPLYSRPEGAGPQGRPAHPAGAEAGPAGLLKAAQPPRGSPTRLGSPGVRLEAACSFSSSPRPARLSGLLRHRVEASPAPRLQGTRRLEKGPVGADCRCWERVPCTCTAPELVDTRGLVPEAPQRERPTDAPLWAARALGLE